MRCGDKREFSISYNIRSSCLYPSIIFIIKFNEFLDSAYINWFHLFGSKIASVTLKTPECLFSAISKKLFKISLNIRLQVLLDQKILNSQLVPFYSFPECCAQAVNITFLRNLCLKWGSKLQTHSLNHQILNIFLKIVENQEFFLIISSSS